MKNFYAVLVNTLIANVTSSYLWFALTFWAYLETRSVLVTGIVGGSYMLFVALFSIAFGTIVDKNKKKNVMVLSSAVTLTSYILAGLIFSLVNKDNLLDLNQIYFWLFSGVILIGGVVENMRNIALSTTVTLLVPEKQHANANGLVGTVQGISFIITSVFSGLSIGLLGMGWTLVVAGALTAVALVHMLTVKVPEDEILHDPELANKRVDIKGSIRAIKAVHGLFALIIFSTFNNFIGGVYMALMDPYGLTLFSVELWGTLFGLASTGFVIGGIFIGKFGLGKNPMKTLLITAIIMGLLGSLFTVRESAILYMAGTWLYMALIPIMEASEQTLIQKVVPFKTQGRVFGFAQAFESAAAPITAFAIAPIAEFWIIPYMKSPEGKDTFGWLLGQGDVRGIALVFFVTGLILTAVAFLAFYSKSYKLLSKSYLKT